MTLASTGNRVSSAGNGVTTNFSFPYKFFQDEDLIVILRDADDVETTQVLDTDYTVSGEGEDAGGTITMVTAPATGETLVIYRDPEQTQDLDLVENDPLPVEELEERLDKLTMMVQRLTNRLDRSLVQKETDADGALEIPLSTERASKFLAFDADGDPIAADAIDGDGVVVSSFAETLLDDTSAAAMRATLGFFGISANIAEPDLGDGVVSSRAAASSILSPQSMFNYGLTPSVGSNALTITLKSQGNGTPSAADIVKMAFRSGTLTSGIPVIGTAVAATSVVVSSGSTLGHTSGASSPIYVYALYVAGTIELAVSTTLFDEGNRVSTTAEGGAGAADSNAVMYSTTARSNVPFRLIGRMLSTQTTAGTWAAVPTAVALPPFEAIPIVASVTRATSQSISDNTDTKVQWGTKDIDPYNCFDASTNYRFTVPKEGYYRISGHITFGGTTGTGPAYVALFKNGSGFGYEHGAKVGNGNFVWGISFDFLIVGSVAEYFEINVLQNTGGAVNILGIDSIGRGSVLNIAYLGRIP